MKNVKVTKDGTARLMAMLRELERNQVLVGVPSTTANRDTDPDDPSPLNNAEIAYIQNFGSPAANIPARPFMEPGIAVVRDAIAKRYRDGTKAILEGRIKNADVVHNVVGLIAQASIQAKITDGPFAPLSPRTIAARKARGVTRTKPLIDTGQLRQAITYVIRPKGSG